ncbi:MAG TPA: penicillin acylase family protein [Armatimonadetes bacterium]|nr:penicillin acylase family protein [Armatimonadota bacterium]
MPQMLAQVLFGRWLVVLLTLGIFGVPLGAERATIYRDTWGVPHIYGDSEVAVAYAHGYAQAEDRLTSILRSYRLAEGSMAEAFGEKWVEHDFTQRLVRHAQLCREHYSELSPEVRAFIEAFLAGFKQYLREHPSEVPEWAPDPQPYHLLALGRYIIWNWPWGEAWGDLRRAPKGPDTGKGSNQWAVTPSHAADGCTITLIDPHVPWTPEWLFYEVHLHGGDLNVYGFCIPGTPYVGLGHNDYLSWACTTGGPDTADVYREEFNPDNPLQYRYDGQWREATRETLEIRVKTEDGFETRTREVIRTHHGPVMKREGNVGYAFKTAYDHEFGLIEQLARMNKARNLGEFINALGMRQFMAQNIMVGDVYGNIYYVRNGRVPIRPEGYDWSRPVPGDTSATEWRGIHPFCDLVQLLNPAAGFMQNCNISPGTMTRQSPLTPDRYRDYLYRASATGTNPRGQRALGLLDRRGKLTREEALGIAVDTFVKVSEPWKQALQRAYTKYRREFPQLEKAVRILQEWNGYATVDSVGMSLFRALFLVRREFGDRLPRRAIEAGEELTGEAERTLLQALAKAVQWMQEKYGSLEVPWGKIHRGRRGERSWPLAGVDSGGLVTLRAIDTPDEPDENGIYWAKGGQSCPTVIFFTQPIRAYSAVPYGQSERPDSPHYTDQGEQLYARSRLKPTWYAKEELMQHLESQKTLRIPERLTRRRIPAKGRTRVRLRP